MFLTPAHSCWIACARYIRYLYNLPQLTSLNNAFTALTEINGLLYIISNGRLQSIDNSFTSLQTVASSMYIYANAQLTSVSGSFTQLVSIAQNFYLYVVHTPKKRCLEPTA